MHQETVPEILKSTATGHFYLQGLPDGMHPWAMHAAVDANCLAAQNNDAYGILRINSRQPARGGATRKQPACRLMRSTATLLQGQNTILTP